jgi:GNAT superfamily N-acetyltransferase
VIARPATEWDLSSIVALLGELHDPPTAMNDSKVWQAIQSQNGRTLLVAEDDSGVLGTADMIVVPNLTHGGRPWAMVENIVVLPDRRRSGVGRLLLDDVFARARAANCYKVQLMSNQKREEAHFFYDAFGFEPSAQGFRLYLDEQS